MSTNLPACKSAPKGHKPIVGSEGSDGKWDQNRASSIVPDPSPTDRATAAAKRVAPHWRMPNALPLTHNRYAETNMAQMKEQNKTPEKELSDKEIANLSHVEFKMQVVKMLTEMVEMWSQNRGKSKGYAK